MKEIDEKELNIMAALASSVHDEMKLFIKDVQPYIIEKLEFLADAGIIEYLQSEYFTRHALHMAVDFTLDDIKNDDEEESEEDCQSDCECISWRNNKENNNK